MGEEKKSAFIPQDLLGECGHTKVTKKKGTKKNKFNWEPIHLQALKKIKHCKNEKSHLLQMYLYTLLNE